MIDLVASYHTSLLTGILTMRAQDDGAPEPLERRKSSFTQLMGQASVLQELFRRYHPHCWIRSLPCSSYYWQSEQMGLV